jgi:hypothetical protein
MKCLDAKFKTLPHEVVTVSLETGTEDSGINGYHQGKTIKGSCMGLSDSSQELPIGSNTVWQNLVNGNAPLEKFIVENPMDCKEYLTSPHHSDPLRSLH